MQIKEVFNDTLFEDHTLVYTPSAKLVRTNNSDLQQLIIEVGQYYVQIHFIYFPTFQVPLHSILQLR